MKSVNDIRSGFLEFFKRNGHEIRPSGSLMPHNDPTIMFTNAGMNQFKNVFTGVEKLPFTRAATSQKCVRAGGKHNDLENVGYTARHHTFFEMLGNFSFGDYFKADAIRLAWELLTKDFHINPDRLSFTVYHTDDEAFDLWKKITGCDDRRILRVPTKDNFWSMGDTGPCGPCSEIFYDHGEKAGKGEWALASDGSDKFGERFVEIWNLVFMQYEQVDLQTRIELPKPSIDTGMGLERISAVLQGVHDNYDIDLFKALIGVSQRESGNSSPESSISHRVIADHLRSSCFLIADGILPSNEGRGYVLRRIMRRAMRHAHQLGCKDPMMHRLAPALIEQMGSAYPELVRAQATIIDNLKQEEERFKDMLGRGLKLLEEESASLSKGQKLPGEAAFKLYDTYGFPLDLTQDILRARGIEVDMDSFEKAMENQREMARAAWSGSGEKATGKIWFELKEKLGATKFLGYEHDEGEGKVLAVVRNGESVKGAGAGDEAYIILDQTPFYGESGGQIGDTGEFRNVAMIADTQKPVEDFIIHKATLSNALKVGDTVHAAIDSARRNSTRANHSATHLLHKVLRETLGEHVTQKGSLVAPERLRFDISHPKAVTPDELRLAERAVNEVIARGGAVECREMTPDDAIKAGAMALFGEKYGDKVRVLGIGRKTDDSAYSVELCGGTHVRDAKDIGLFKITSEGSVASGIRRIEAVTGEGVRSYYIEALSELSARAAELHKEHRRLHNELAEAHQKLREEQEEYREKPVASYAASLEAISRTPIDSLQPLAEKEILALQAHIEILQEDNKKLAKTLAEARKQLALAGRGGEAQVEKIGDVQFIGKIFEGLEPKDLRGMAEAYLKKAEPVIVAVGTSFEGKASIVVAVDKSLAETYNAAAFIQAAVAEVGGKGGGGKPVMAQGGGPEGGKLQAAIDKIKSMLAA